MDCSRAVRGKAIPTAPGEMERQFKDMQNEITGRVAFTSLVMSALTGYIWSDNCHGDGHRDPAVQRVRDKAGWERRACRSPVDGKWYSYEALGPQYAEWIAFVSNVADSFDDLGTAKTEEAELDKIYSLEARNLSASSAAIQPVPAAVMACL